MLIWDRATGELGRQEPSHFCSFGITEAIGAFFAAAGAAVGGTGALGAAIGTGLEGAAIGGAVGAGVDAITGKPILPGLAEGAITGGAIGGVGSALGGALGVGTTAGDVLAGAGAGAASSSIFGGSPLTGALAGGASGALSGALSGTSSALSPGATGGTGGAATPTVGAGSGPGAGAIAAPASVGADPGGLFAPTSPGASLALPSDTASGALLPSTPLSAPSSVSSALSSALPDTTVPTGTPLSSSDAAGLQSSLAASQAGSASSLNPAVSGQSNSNSVLGAVDPASGIAVTQLNPTADQWASGALTQPQTPASPFTSAYDSVANLFGAGQPVDVVPPIPPNGEIGPVINPATGQWSFPGDAGYGDAISQLSAAPQAQAAAGGGASDSGGIGSFIKSYGGPLIAAGGLGATLLRGATPLPNQNALSGEASQLATQGQQLQSYLQTGTLPPGVSQAINQATESAKAQIRSQYAALGQTGSSSENQDLASVDQQAASQGASIATQLLSQGVSETQLSGEIYNNLLNVAISNNAQLGSAIGNLATSLAYSGGGSRPVVLQTQNAPG